VQVLFVVWFGLLWRRRNNEQAQPGAGSDRPPAASGRTANSLGITKMKRFAAWSGVILGVLLVIDGAVLLFGGPQLLGRSTLAPKTVMARITGSALPIAIGVLAVLAARRYLRNNKG